MSTAYLGRFAAAAAVLAAISTPAFAQPKDPTPLWDMQVGASFVGTSGNSDTSSAGADFATNRRGRVWQFESTATAVRTSSLDSETAERYLGQARLHRELTAVIGVTSGEKLERDKFSGIRFRSILDAGLSWHLVRTTEWTVDGVTSLAWDHERSSLSEGRNDTTGVLQLLSRIPFGGAGDTTERFTLYPDLTDGSATRSETELTAQAAMSTHLALKIGYLLRYAHSPVPGFKKTDSTTTASVVLRWKASTPAPVQ